MTPSTLRSLLPILMSCWWAPMGCSTPPKTCKKAWAWTPAQADALASRITDCHISVLRINRDQDLHLAGHSGGSTYGVSGLDRLFFDAYLGHSIDIYPQHPLAPRVLTIPARDLRLGVYALHLWNQEQPPCPWYDRGYWAGATESLEYEVVLDGAPLHGFLPYCSTDAWPERSRRLIEHCKTMQTSPLLLSAKP